MASRAQHLTRRREPRPATDGCERTRQRKFPLFAVRPVRRIRPRPILHAGGSRPVTRRGPACFHGGEPACEARRRLRPWQPASARCAVPGNSTIDFVAHTQQSPPGCAHDPRLSTPHPRHLAVRESPDSDGRILFAMRQAHRPQLVIEEKIHPPPRTRLNDTPSSRCSRQSTPLSLSLLQQSACSSIRLD